ncbi:MAG TPA: DUF4157 domain-containing protein [Kofleriaceae bacterium]|nr:DUF4157 domain-containing protein [Kofleriaceae bacterium]
MIDRNVQMSPASAPSAAEPAAASAESAGTGEQYTSRGAIPAVGGASASASGPSASEQAFGFHAAAEHGVSGAGGSLPHAAQIQASFGADHDISGIQAHVGGPAAAATHTMGAQAYATGNSVAFGAPPDLHTAAHEAAHVVQQRGGVQLKGGVGQAGDAHEQNADAVADRVVAGKSASDLLPAASGGGTQAVQSKAVQCLGYELGKPLPAGADTPQYGEDPDQRRYSVDQYEKMWEAEQGKKLTDPNKRTIERGCIGISANNIDGGGNPLDYAVGTFGTFDQAHKFMEGKNKELHEMRANPQQAHLAPEGEYVLFAQLFWSNQKDGDNAEADDNAFKADPKTGRMDMTGYKYKARPGYVNFDYGFWDDTSQCFWHANHMQYPGDKGKTDPMKVYQSTKEHFIRGYIDFDRIVFGVALAKNYDPGKAAMNALNNSGGGH